jgi:uncharacterized membrane protein
MKFCSNCGGQIPEGTAFCPTCGAAVAQNVNQQPQQQVAPTQQPGQQYNGQPNVGGVDTNTEKIVAIVSYLSIIGLILHFAKAAKTPFGQFHVKQAANLSIIEIIASIAVSVLRVLISQLGIPFVGSILGLVNTAIYILGLVGLIWAAQGKMDKLPVVGNIEILK